MQNDKLVLTRNYTVEQTNAEARNVKVQLVETITCEAAGYTLQLVSVKPKENGEE